MSAAPTASAGLTAAVSAASTAIASTNPGGTNAPATATNPEPEVVPRIEKKMEDLLETLRQVGIVVADYSQEEPLIAKVKSIVELLQSLESLKTDVADVKVPYDIFDYVDNSENPELYTRDILQRTLESNLRVNGKIHSLKRLRDQLESKFEASNPDEVERFRELRRREEPK